MDNELWSSIKNTVKNMFKIKRNFIILIILIILLPLLLGAFVYYIDVDNGTNKADDPSSVGGAVTRNNGSANISLKDGNLSTTKTAQELWDELIKNGSDVNDYLKSPEELAKLMKAEIVTQYPDTRKNPDEKINWEELLKPDSKELNGIIKLNRRLTGEKEDILDEEIKNLDKEYEKYKEDIERKQKERKKKEEKDKEEEKDKDKEEENKELEKLMSKDEWMKNKGFTINNGKWQKDKTIRMVYTDVETFENKMKQYRKTGSEEDKKEAMKYFTLEKSNAPRAGKGISKVGSLENVLFIGDSITVGLEQGKSQLEEKNREKIEKSIFRAEVGKDANYWITNYNRITENKNVKAICILLGVNNPDVNSMKNLINKLSIDYPDKNIYIQRVFPVGESYNNAVEFNKRIEQYNYDVEAYCNQKEKVFFIDTTEGYVNDRGFLEQSMSQPDGLHLKDNNKWLENILSNIIEVKEVSKGNSKSKKDNKNKDKEKSDKAKKKNKGTFNRKPDFQNQEAWKHPYNKYAYGQCTWFACGRFFEMYGLDGYFQGKGNGYQWVDNIIERYPDKFTKSNTPVPGAIFSGDVAHNHVGVVIDVQGENLIIQEGNLDVVDNDFEWASTECTNGKLGKEANGDWWEREVTLSVLKQNYGNVTFANPNDSLSSLSNKTNYQGASYYVKVATWSETYSELTGESDGGKVSANPPIHEMTATRINYYDMVRGYTMPFDYLWALMVITEDKDFVMGLADLVYNSNIEITINDNKTVTTITENYEYDKMMDVFETATIEVKNKKDKNDPNKSETVQIIEKIKEGKGIKQGTNIAKLVTTITTNTVDAGVTRANTWIVDYTKGYKITNEATDTGDGEKIERKDLNDNPKKMKYGKSDNRDVLNFMSELQGQEVVSIESKYKEYTTNWTLSTNTHIDSTKFIETTPYVREKTSKKKKPKKERKDKKDFKYKEKNFVTLLLSNQKAYGNIFSVDSWLFEILEANDSTKETMVDLTKYLLYRTKDRDDWNVTEFDFSIFEPGKFTEVGGFEGISGDTAEEQVWNALIKAGYSPIATAGVMGNIKHESGFVFDSIEAGNSIGYGLVQWSFGRRTALENFAASRGKNKADPEIQLEFLLAELTPGGGADGYASYQLGGSSSPLYDGRSYTAEDWKNANDTDTATIAFMSLFERPRYDSSINHIAGRKQSAKEYYEKYK